MSIIPHIFNDQKINQAQTDLQFGKYQVPAGYVNLTEMCKANSKQLAHYKTLKATNAYLEVIYDETGIAISLLMVDVSTYWKEGTQGTWGHIEVALDLAAWISPKFRYWANRVLRAVIDGNFQALTPDAEEAKQKLEVIWNDLREYTKESFWFMGDAVKQYYLDNPRVERYSGQNYSEVFNALNVGLFGMEAKDIRAELGIGKSTLNRDHFGKQALKRIEIVQRLAEAQMRRGKVPVDAVNFAIDNLNYQVSSYTD